MNWKYLLTLILVVAAVGALALAALESAPRPDVSGKVVAHSPIDGIAVPGTNGKVMAYPNGVYSIQPENFAVSTALRDMPDRDAETIAKELATPSWKNLAKQKRINQVNEDRGKKGLPPMDEEALADFEINEQNAKLVKKTKPGLGADAGDGKFTDPLIAKGQIDLNAPQAMPTPSLTFNGATAADNAAVGVGGLSPPDTNGDVGPNHYVSSVNLAMKIFDKSGTVIGTPKKTSDLWAALPANDPCRTRNDGDPIVLYDQLADRWHISQFSIPGFVAGSGANFQCVAVSTSGDPTGSYFVWSYAYPGNVMNDYPKVGVWPDAYHMTFNQFNNAGTAFLGAGFFSQDRPKALAGDPTASAVYRNIATTDPDAGGILPPDVEGFRPPPAGMAAVFMEFRATEFGDPADAIRAYRWVPDFANPASSAFSVLTDTNLAAFDPRQPSGRTDIEQSGGSALDSIADRVMHRLVYRNLGTQAAPVNSIAGSFTVNVGGVTPTSAATYQAGLRWFELRRTGDAFTVFDEGTLLSGAVDPAAGLNNWMSSISSDSQGNLALGYSQSSTTQNADIKIAGRTGAPTGALNEGEALFFDALGAQTSSNRWGDYSMMSVDPSDDCTFWYTQEYYASGGTGVSWSTRVGKFKYPSCTAAPTGTISGTITSCSSGLPIQSANVTATGGFQRLSIANGTYSMLVAPGDYTVNADKAPGFVGASQGVNVTAGGNATANICLTGVPVLTSGTAAIVTESCGLPNGVPDPGEALSVSLPLINNGGAATANLTATLQATGGVTSPGPAQNYGALAASGGTDTKTFTFTASPSTTCGNSITLTWDLQDGATNYGTVVKTFGTGTPVINLTQNFDSVTAPALPAGWVQNQTSGTGITWTTSTTSPNSAPNAAFANDPNTVNAAALETPAFAVSVPNAVLTFRNFFDTEDTFDGMVLEIKIGAGAWTDIIVAGGSFTAGGYTDTISSNFQSPIAGRQAWAGTSGGFITTTANLPAAAQGQNVQLRWLMATDSSVSDVGVRVDDIQVTAGVTCNGPCAPAQAKRADYDGDGTTDLSVYRPSQGNWYMQRSLAGFLGVNWGSAGDTPMAGDIDGDNKTDLIVRRHIGDTQQADFHVLKTGNFTYEGIPWGFPSDLAVIGDYDADGKDEVAVFRPSDHYFYIRDEFPVYRAIMFGNPGDVPLSADFDGDGRTDLAVFRPSTGFWYYEDTAGSSITSFNSFAWGLSTDKLVPADYDGDLKDDVAVYRPSDGTWYIRQSSNGQFVFTPWGLATDIPVPGDYDGDGKYDIAVYRPSDGNWYIRQSSNGQVRISAWGVSEDKPAPAMYLP